MDNSIGYQPYALRLSRAETEEGVWQKCASPRSDTARKEGGVIGGISFLTVTLPVSAGMRDASCRRRGAATRGRVQQQ